MSARRFWEDDGLCGSYSNTRPPITPGLATHSRSAHFGLVAVSFAGPAKQQQIPIRILDDEILGAPKAAFFSVW